MLICCGSQDLNLESHLCHSIQAHIDGLTPTPPQVIVDQVKEKFGTLLFYFHGGDDELNGIKRAHDARAREIAKDADSLDRREKKISRDEAAIMKLRTELADRKRKFDEMGAALA